MQEIIKIKNEKIILETDLNNLKNLKRITLKNNEVSS